MAAASSKAAALITGGDSGIARAVAIAYAREGADVAIAYLPAEEDDAQETLRLVYEAGRKGLALPGDIREEAHCAELVRRTVDELGGLDILVNNAAYQMSTESIQEPSTEQFDRVMRTNVYAMFWLSKAAVSHMQPGSSIINTSSIQAYQPSPELLDYATSKAAIVNFTRGLAQSLVTGDPRQHRGARSDLDAADPLHTARGEGGGLRGQRVADGRAGQPAEVAPAYVFLASAEAGYITGERIGVHGGTPLP